MHVEQGVRIGVLQTEDLLIEAIEGRAKVLESMSTGNMLNAYKMHIKIKHHQMSISVAVPNVVSHVQENREEMQMQWQLPGFSEIAMLFVFTGKLGLDAALMTKNSSKF